LLARALVLGGDGGRSYTTNGYAGDPPPVAPAAPPVLSAREKWRADIERFSRSNVLAEQVHARRLVLQGEPPEPAPTSPTPPAVPT
jgi:hypothetical protein